MSKIYQKISRFSLVFIPALSIGFSSYCYAQSIPEVYNFLPQDALATLNIKTSEAAWPVLSMNKSLKKIDFLKELKSDKNDNPIDIILDPQIRSNIGNNLLVSLSAIDMSKEPQILMVAEMKNTSKINFIKNKFNNIYLTKKSGKLLESKYRNEKIYSYIAKDPKNTKYDPAFLAFHNNYVLMSNNFESMQNSMKSFYKESPGISYSSDFIKSYDKLGSEHQLQLFLNMKKLEKFVSGIDKSKNDILSGKMTKDMNLSMFKNIFSNSSMMINFQLNPQNIELKTYSYADKSTNYYKTLQQSKPSDFKKYTNYIPKNTLLFMGISDLKEAGNNVKDLLAFDTSKDFEKMFQESTGINVFDFADNLKNDMAIAAFNTDSNPLIPGFAFFMTPIDKEKMNEMFKSIKIDLSNFEKKTNKGNRKQHEGDKKDEKSEIMQFSDTTTYKDITIYRTNELTSMAELNARPAYAFLGEDVILASNEEALKTIIDRSSSTTTDFTLNGNDSFVKLKKAFGENNNSIFYLNLSTIINMVSSFLEEGKDSKEMITNLKRFEGIGANSLTDEDGSMGRVLILADLQNIDFNKLFPADKKTKVKNNNKKMDKK